jgi:FAD/FMN-containing dehydrogenase
MSAVPPAGLRLGTREWTDTTGPGIVSLPVLDGVLSTRDSDLAAAAADFGNWIQHRPLAVLQPGTSADIAAIVRFGRECGLTVVARGSGHSVDGQSQIQDGITVSMRSLARIDRCGPDEISVDAGATWNAVVAATLRQGLVPPVLPDYLELTAGGTLAAGGIGGTSHRYGCQADNVRDLDVVTPDGELVSCSPTRNAELFDAVRGTQGQHGIITRATLALVPAPSAARRYLLTYHDVGTFLADQRRLIADQRFDSVLGQACHAGPAGWQYILEAMRAFTPPQQSDDRALLAGLSHDRGSERIETSGYRDFLHRLEPLEAELRSVGSWQRHPHPRCTLLLSGRHAEAIIAGELDASGPQDIGYGGSVLIYAIPTARLVAPRMPKAQDPVTVVFGVQRTAPPGDLDTLERMRQANTALTATVTLLGGTGYSNLTDYHKRLRDEVDTAA